jgi:hypothetical protein
MARDPSSRAPRCIRRRCCSISPIRRRTRHRRGALDIVAGIVQDRDAHRRTVVAVKPLFDELLPAPKP